MLQREGIDITHMAADIHTAVTGSVRPDTLYAIGFQRLGQSGRDCLEGINVLHRDIGIVVAGISLFGAIDEMAHRLPIRGGSNKDGPLAVKRPDIIFELSDIR